MPTRSRLVLLLSVACPMAYPVAAQQAPVPPGTVHLNVAVTEKSGTPVPGLTQQDFILTDNNTAAPITAFRAATPALEPVQVVLVLDAVNTPFSEVAYEQGQLQKFLKSNEGKLSYPTNLAVITDTGTQSEQTFTTDGNALSASLDHYSAGLRQLRRDSGIYGADERLELSLKAVGQLTSYVAGLPPGRKILVWLSPGWPLLSGPRIQLDAKQQKQIFANIISFSTQLRKANVTLYTINPLGAQENLLRANYYQEFLKGVGSPGKVDLGDLALPVLALQSGGLALQASTDVAGMLRRCFEDIQSWYEISFDPAPANSPEIYHHVDLKVARPGLTVRTRDGYYTQPAPSPLR